MKTCKTWITDRIFAGDRLPITSNKSPFPFEIFSMIIDYIDPWADHPVKDYIVCSSSLTKYEFDKLLERRQLKYRTFKLSRSDEEFLHFEIPNISVSVNLLTLKNLRLANTTCREIATPLLFKRITLYGGIENAIKRMKGIGSASQVTRYVKELSIFADLIEKESSFFVRAKRTINNALASIVQRQIYRKQMAFKDALGQFLRSCPKIACIILQDVEIGKWAKAPERWHYETKHASSSWAAQPGEPHRVMVVDQWKVVWKPLNSMEFYHFIGKALDTNMPATINKLRIISTFSKNHVFRGLEEFKIANDGFNRFETVHFIIRHPGLCKVRSHIPFERIQAFTISSNLGTSLRELHLEAIFVKVEPFKNMLRRVSSIEQIHLRNVVMTEGKWANIFRHIREEMSFLINFRLFCSYMSIYPSSCLWEEKRSGILPPPEKYLNLFSPLQEDLFELLELGKTVISRRVEQGLPVDKHLKDLVDDLDRGSGE